MQTEGGGGKLLITCGCLFFGSIVVLMFLITIFVSIFDDAGSIDQNIMQQLNDGFLTKNGKEYYEDHKDEMEEKFLPASTQSGIHWAVLAAIRDKDVDKDDQDSCDDYWIGPMKIKELNWSGNQLLNEFPNAKTNFSNCGDINDDFQDRLKELKRLDDYRNQARKNLKDCEQKAKDEKKEQFCQAFGIDANDDKKADPKDEKDAIASVANLLSSYRQVYGNLAQALNLAYGENEKFLHKVKIQLLTWLRDPSTDGILRWPLHPYKAYENKVVTKRGETGLTIQSKDGETVLAVGSGVITEVGQDPSCGEYVKLVHQFQEDGQDIATIHCNLKEIKVKKGDMVNIGAEIGKVKQQSLTIKMMKVKKEESGDDNKNNNNQETSINPEEYLVAPEVVKYEGQEEQ